MGGRRRAGRSGTGRARVDRRRLRGFNNWGPNRALLTSGGVGDLVSRPDPLYLISKGPVEGFKTDRVFDCHPWLPYAITRISILKREVPEAHARSRPDGGEGVGRPGRPEPRPVASRVPTIAETCLRRPHLPPPREGSIRWESEAIGRAGPESVTRRTSVPCDSH